MQATKIELRRKDAAAPWGFRLSGGTETGTPLLIDQVTTDSIADKSGIVPGDLVVSIGGDNAVNMTHLQAKQAIIRCGNEIDIRVVRQPWQHRVATTQTVSPKCFEATNTTHRRGNLRQRPLSANLECMTWSDYQSPSSPMTPRLLPQNGHNGNCAHSTVNGGQSTVTIRSGRRSREHNFVTSANIRVIIGNPKTGGVVETRPISYHPDATAIRPSYDFSQVASASVVSSSTNTSNARKAPQYCTWTPPARHRQISQPPNPRIYPLQDSGTPILRRHDQSRFSHASPNLHRHSDKPYENGNGELALSISSPANYTPKAIPKAAKLHRNVIYTNYGVLDGQNSALYQQNESTQSLLKPVGGKASRNTVRFAPEDLQ